MEIETPLQMSRITDKKDVSRITDMKDVNQDS
jgi:hypothetical protein